VLNLNYNVGGCIVESVLSRCQYFGFETSTPYLAAMLDFVLNKVAPHTRHQDYFVKYALGMHFIMSLRVLIYFTDLFFSKLSRHQSFHIASS
jgi:hypothetical protein